MKQKNTVWTKNTVWAEKMCQKWSQKIKFVPKYIQFGLKKSASKMLPKNTVWKKNMAVLKIHFFEPKNVL